MKKYILKILKIKGDLKMKVFVSGSKNVSAFDNEILKVLNRIVENNHEILVGDCDGVDASIQRYMQEKSHTNITVYFVGSEPRNAQEPFKQRKVDTFGKLTPYEYYQQKDIQMTRDADVGFVIWDETSKGSRDNIQRLIQMDKPVVIYSTKRNKLLRMKSKYSPSEVFMNVHETAGATKNTYKGRLKPEFIGFLTDKQIADICDNYDKNFGYNVKIDQNGYFTCEIYVD